MSGAIEEGEHAGKLSREASRHTTMGSSSLRNVSRCNPHVWLLHVVLSADEIGAWTSDNAENLARYAQLIEQIVQQIMAFANQSSRNSTQKEARSTLSVPHCPHQSIGNRCHKIPALRAHFQAAFRKAEYSYR